MKTRIVSVVALMFLAVFVTPASADKVVSIDIKAKLITVDSGKGLKAYRLLDPIEVHLSGAIGQVDQIKPGMDVTLGLADAERVNRITVGPTANALGDATAIEATHHIDFKAKVDGVDLVSVRDGKMWIEHKDWSKPVEITVNGRSWRPVWNGNTSDQFTTFLPPLRPFGATPIEIRKVKGRGSATIKQTPTAENGQTLIFEVNDSKESGAALYEVHIKW